MSLYVVLAFTAGAALILRFRYGPDAIRYGAAALFFVLFLFSPIGPVPGLGGWSSDASASLEEQIERIGTIVSFATLFLAAILAGWSRPMRPE